MRCDERWRRASGGSELLDHVRQAVEVFLRHAAGDPDLGRLRPHLVVEERAVEDDDLTGSLLPVLKEQDGRLRVRDYLGKEGWADKANFVRLTDAPAFFTDVIRKDPKSVWAWTMRANAWPASEADNAIRDHTEAIRLDPKCVSAYYGRAG